MHYRPDTLTTANGTTLIHALDFGFNLNNELNTIDNGVNPTLNQVLTYDDNLRLDLAEGAYGQFDYEYDGVGNRLDRILTGTDNDFLEAYNYPNNSHRLDEITSSGPGQNRGFGYSPVGNITSDGSRTFDYNHRNRLTTVTEGGVQIASYVYNPMGQRIVKTALGTTTHFHYDQNNLLLSETNADGSFNKDYIYLGSQLIAVTKPVEDTQTAVATSTKVQAKSGATTISQSSAESESSMSASGGSFGVGWSVALVGLVLLRVRQFSRSYMGTVGALVVALFVSGCGGGEEVEDETALYFVHSDHLGTPEVVTDKDKAPVWEGQKDPFGKTEVVTNSIDLNVRYPGQYFDEETGMHYNIMRYYDPSMGRYLQSDPIGLLGGMSTYGYAYQNPNMYYDPDGEIAFALIPVLIGGGISGGTLGHIIGGGILLATLAHIAENAEDCEEECDMELIREVYYGGETKTCLYRSKGNMFTFPQDKELSCMPVDQERCLVDTSYMGPKARRAHGGGR